MKFILHNTRCNIIDHLVEVRDATPQSFGLLDQFKICFIQGSVENHAYCCFKFHEWSSDAIDIIGQTKDKSYSLSDLVGVLNHVN